VEVTLRPAVSRPDCLGVRRPSGTRNQFYFLLEISFRQLRVCNFVAPSLTKGWVCNLLYNYFWALPEQSHLGPSLAELTAIFYCLTRLHTGKLHSLVLLPLVIMFGRTQQISQFLPIVVTTLVLLRSNVLLAPVLLRSNVLLTPLLLRSNVLLASVLLRSNVLLAPVLLHSNVLLVTMEMKSTSRCIATDICRISLKWEVPRRLSGTWRRVGLL
jgi:hypothetical protein